MVVTTYQAMFGALRNSWKIVTISVMCCPKRPKPTIFLAKENLSSAKVFTCSIYWLQTENDLFSIMSLSDFWLWSIFWVSGKEFGTVFINIGRSNVIKEAELLEAIQKGWIREAVLDVFDQGKIKFSQKYLLQVVNNTNLVLLLKDIYRYL